MYSGPDTLERVGFPIRTSADQRSLASPRGFSQRATSFIASWRQGIHRTPLSHSKSRQQRPHAGPNRAPPCKTSSTITSTQHTITHNNYAYLLTNQSIFTCQRTATPPAQNAGKADLLEASHAACRIAEAIRARTSRVENGAYPSAGSLEGMIATRVHPHPTSRHYP